MGIYQIKPWFQRRLRVVEQYLVKRRVHPDYLTLGALVLSVLGGLALVGSRWFAPLLLLIIPVAIGRTALNALDGLVARGTGFARPFGEVLNEFCDRLSDVALLTGVSFAPGADPRLGAVTIVVMLLSSYLGTAAKAAGGKRQYGGVMGKADRMIYLSAAALLAFLLPGLPIIGIYLGVVLAGLCVTIVQRLQATHADLQSRG
jgi:CDP-diacylglycerol--glycerol-3-phosphate 3-phosphatidyltransferase